MADMIAENHNIILQLPRFGIPLGFGEKSVREVCAAANVPVDFMLLICNVSTFDDYLPELEEMCKTDMSPLIHYLKESHNYYTNERLPHIGQHLTHIADRLPERYGQILKKFYSDFRNEITEHFEEEERLDFPKLLSLQQGRRGEKKGLTPHHEKKHNNLVDKLSDLTQIVYKYLPGNELPEETMELVFDILQLSSDIQKHALIEDRILTPYIGWLERSVR